MTSAAGSDQDNESRPRLIPNDPINMQPSVPLKVPHRSFCLRSEPAIYLQVKIMVPQQMLDRPDVFTT
jgi:hypothetical protein